MARRNESRQAAHAEWIRTLARSREGCRKALLIAERYGASPHAVFPNSQPGKVANAARTLHAAVLEYHDYLRPYRESVPSLWAEELYVANYPDVSAVIEPNEHLSHSETIDDVDEFVIPLLNRSPRPVSLKTLKQEWRMASIQATVRVHKEFKGMSEFPWSRRVWLPPAASESLYSQLNQILEELELAAQVAEVRDGDVPVDAPEHVQQGAPAYQTQPRA